MLKNFMLFTAIAGFVSLAQSQADSHCSTKFHSQFDFWLGDWVVFDTAGTQVGENTITKLEKGCLLSEHWRGGKGGTGRSYNYFNRTDSTWNQVWIDSFGSHLVLKGKAKPNEMVLKSDLHPGKKVDFYYNEITWTKLDDGSVSQVWNILNKEGKLLKHAFYGIYRKKTE